MDEFNDEQIKEEINNGEQKEQINGDEQRQEELNNFYEEMKQEINDGIGTKPAEKSRKRKLDETDGPDADEPSSTSNMAGGSTTAEWGADPKIMRMMKMSGYQEGKGLGKKKQGIVEAIQVQQKFDRRALGADTADREFLAENFDETSEIKDIKEEPTWLTCTKEKRDRVQQEIKEEWIVIEKPKLKLDDEDRYCSRELIAQLLSAKSIFDTVDDGALHRARQRANPYETIKSGFFQNRAAMKTANLDKIYGWRLSREFDEKSRHGKNPMKEGQQRQNTDRPNPLFYFADVCAGPGGFSEYMLWRKAFYNSKGFGFTLTGRDDFKLSKFQAASPEYFEPYYGVHEDGDVMNPENLESLERFVQERIHSQRKGVHLVMCDGGFSVEGQENIQEILSKRLYLCQFIVGLSLCRVKVDKSQGGNFLCKLFDVFTPFSMGLIYLMYTSFEKISIHKPITSRPANSERYIFCENLNQFGAEQVKQFLVKMNTMLNGMNPKHEDIRELVPAELIEEDEDFMKYMRESNEEIARRQIFYLHKYRRYAMEPGIYDQDQTKLRDEALVYWDLPNFIERNSELAKRNNQLPQNQQHYQRESVSQMVKRYAGYQPFPYPKRLPKFTASESQLGADINELRCAFLVDSAEPVMFISQGNEQFFMQRRSDSNISNVGDLHCTIPKDTILLAQFAYIYEKKGESEGSKFEPMASKCVWILDAAVLNGDNICHLEWKDRMAAARKFADAINQRQLRRVKFEHTNKYNKNKNRHNQAQFAGYSKHPFSQLIVAEPMRLNNLTQRKFTVMKLKGAKTAAFPVWAMDEPRDQPPQRYFLACRGVRVVNRLNPNFMLQYGKHPESGQQMEALVSRVNFSQAEHNPHATFYEHMIGHMPSEQWISAYPMGHPNNGAITFQWSWEPDYNLGFEVENILNDPEHKGGLTMPKLKQLLADHSNNHKSNGTTAIKIESA